MSYIKSYAHAQRYASYIKEIVDRWPQVSLFTPTPPITSVDTLATRIRIVLNAVRDNIQDSAPTWDLGIDTQRFLACCDEVVVSTTAHPGKVTCGPYDLVRKQTPLGVSVECDLHVPAGLRITNPDIKVIDAIVVLHHYQILVEPTILTTTTDILAIGYDKTFDIAISKNGDEYTIL